VRSASQANVLVGTDGHIKVGDFGVSNALHQSQVQTHVGSQCYQAPERITAVPGSLFAVSFVFCFLF
jgi:serine/threonine protein kinase